MHKIIMENEVILLGKENYLDIKNNSNLIIYLKGSGNVEINIEENCNVIINHLGVDLSNEIVINLNKENSQVIYNYSTINYQDNTLKMIINHNSDNTESNVYNHGVNVTGRSLLFEVTGVVPKNIKKCICNQENRIANIIDSNSVICPNLLIDSYDTISSHSAYIGKFSDEVLFYLMTRGITKTKAYELLIKSLLLPASIEKDKVDEFIKELENI